jgi:hypothetical protein
MDSLGIHPNDQICLSFDRLSMENVRTIVDTSYRKAVSGDRRGIGIVARDIPWQSQNGLLKIFEDPPQGVVFFLSIPHEGILLPTLRSRLYQEGTERTAGVIENQPFLHLSVEKRKAHVEDILERDDAKEHALLLLASCERELSKTSKTSAEHRAFLHDIAEFRRNIMGPSPSLKFMLLFLATSLPKREYILKDRKE